MLNVEWWKQSGWVSVSWSWWSIDSNCLERVWCAKCNARLSLTLMGLVLWWGNRQRHMYQKKYTKCKYVMVFSIHGMTETTVKQTEDQGTTSRFPEGGQERLLRGDGSGAKTKDEGLAMTSLGVEMESGGNRSGSCWGNMCKGWGKKS